ncbi:M28 family peptidase [Phenylobacterium montanum]|uniref:M20/M25/M40 family metallo-hydrolase n=1 Tax=Phenylobacterium montanum TaxID=2823693 RepID=A0A975IX23_9CAUL|nr:M28 family peptidase [Caulobacter sp. S6]QUD90498.1 M20/M25/M40 family metallo-hydrolase [Caulobacter sp. S6]
MIQPRIFAPALAVLALAAPAGAAETGDHPLLHQIAGEISPAQMKATIGTLVGFGTRHTLSDTRSDTRGIGAARRWVKSRFEAMAKDCGGCLEIQTPAQTVTGTRVPNPTEVMDVLAIQRGSEDPDRVVIIAGHLDSRVSDPMNATSDAPGANDDGSGTAAVMEAARVLSRHKFRATIVYAVLSGEEQGLYGGKILADYAKSRGWRVEADLNNDIVGNTEGLNGVRDAAHVRVFSEGTKAVETPEQAAKRRYNGGEVDSPSRNLARFMDGLATRYVKGLSVTMVYRTDRYGRGGDQVPVLEAGYPAVRVTETRENYNRQHQDIRTENGLRYGDVLSGVDFPYLAKVGRLDAVTLAALAQAPAPPEGLKIDGAVSDDTKLSWSASPGAGAYRVWWRATTEPRWSHSKAVAAGTEATLKDVIIDDWFFGVAAVSPDGWESPVEFPGAAGSFLSPPPQPAK